MLLKQRMDSRYRTGGGAQGGEIIAEGTPEDIVKIKSSHTGKFLKKMLK